MDELKKALNGEKTPRSSGFGEGSGERGTFIYNKETRTLERYVEKKKIVDAPAFHRDEILDGIESPLTGEMYYSKSKLRQHYKDNGYRETGGAHLTGKPPPKPKPNYDDIRNDVAKALNDARWGNVPLSERERQAIIEEERQWDYYRKRQK